MEVLLNVIKNIFCSEYKDNCNNCSLCHLIDINNLPSLKIIEPDGSTIKKEQILELKNLFSKNSQYTKENIYIIKNAEKMNKESANTMLKFLEEPDGNIIGFFVTNNSANVMLTIQSRCQNLEVNFQNKIYEKLGITKDKYNEYFEIIIKYLNGIEIEKKELILLNKKYLCEYEKNDIIIIFKIILEIYLSKLNNVNLSENNIEILELLKEFSRDNIIKKVNLIVLFLKEINYNVNIDLLLDRFVIEMDGVNSEIV